MKGLKDYGIKALSDFYAATPPKRFLPFSYRQKGQTRKRLYERGSEFPTNSDIIRHRDMKEIKMLVEEALEQYHQSQNKRHDKWDQMIKDGKIPKNAKIEGFTVQRLYEADYQDEADYQVDHINPLARHWRNQNGNNDDDTGTMETSDLCRASRTLSAISYRDAKPRLTM